MYTHFRHGGPLDPALDEVFANDCRDWGPPCPDGHELRLGELLGFRLKGADYLQLRVALYEYDNGVCLVTVDQRPERIRVRALVHLSEDEERWERAARVPHVMDCPVNVELDAPLGERVVIDLDSGEELPLLIPHWDTDEPSDHQR